jgi:hypothetical protein
MERRPNDTLDRSGGSVFLQVTYFMQGCCNRAARST